MQDLDLNAVIERNPVIPGEPRRIFRRPVNGGSRDVDLLIDNSSLEVFNTCPRASYYKLIRSREKPGGSALTFGKCFHIEAENFYKDKCVYDVEKAAHRILAFFEKFPVPVGEWRTMDLMLDVCAGYFKPYWPEDVGFDIIETENYFEVFMATIEFNGEIPLTPAAMFGAEGINIDLDTPTTYVENIHVYWTGRKDIVERRSSGRLRVWDHKTTSMLGETYWTDFELRSQTVGYTWATSKQYNEPVEEFLANVIAIRKPTKTGKGIEFERRPFLYTQEMQDEWQHDTIHQVNDFLAHIQREYFPKATAWCVGKYKVCPYHSVCVLPREERNTMLMMDQFQNVTWTPKDQQEGGE